MNTAEWWLAFSGVALLGLQTAISPCPLMTNIAAMAYIGRRVGRNRDVLISGLLYAAGQSLTFLTLAFFVLAIPFFSGDQLTRFFTSTLHVLLGPIMIFIGMMLIGLINFPLPDHNDEIVRKIVDKLGLWSALLLGALFAMAFCPTTAATFLAMLVLSGTAKSIFWFPFIFGIGTALPILVFSGILAFHNQYLSRTFQILNRFEHGLRHIASVFFLLIGIFLTLRSLFN
ncbi:MAG: sulfite exporter TauE/SafE family protein [Planctomycetaceae bacterium]|jgi:cytochrome c biogenesis protein CcdA|nr:sulfite exporter TauE/SafE family protein [Planctomycetaceae bacterium]